MSFETGKAAIDFLLKQGKKTKKFDVTFFGGEPLLEFDLIRKLTKYIREREKLISKKIIIGIVTNGTLFTSEIINFFKKNDIGVLFSFEGDKKRMKKIKGERAYRKCLWAIKKLTQKGFKLTARTSIESNELRLVDFAKHIFKLGFRDIVFKEVVEGNWDQAETDKAVMNLAEYFIKEARKGNVLEIYDLIKFLLIRHKAIKPKPLPCGAGKDIFAVTVEGNILPCHYLRAWEQDFVLGNVFEGKINNEKRTRFLTLSRNDFIYCKNCLARSYCSGCCLAISYRYTGNMVQPVQGCCIWTKAQVKAVNYIYDILIKKEKNKYLLNLINELRQYY